MARLGPRFGTGLRAAGLDQPRRFQQGSPCAIRDLSRYEPLPRWQGCGTVLTSDQRAIGLSSSTADTTRHRGQPRLFAGDIDPLAMRLQDFPLRRPMPQSLPEELHALPHLLEHTGVAIILALWQTTASIHSRGKPNLSSGFPKYPLPPLLFELDLGILTLAKLR